MNTVIRHIEYLTRNHDCVVIPGLGAFIAQYESARISDDGMRILPPVRTIAFNGELTHNDGLLASSVARRERMHYEDALSVVKAGVATLIRQLSYDGEVSVGSLGMLEKRSADDGGYVYIPNEKTGLNTEFMALAPVDVSPVSGVQSSQDEREETLVASYNPLRAVLKVAASLAVLVALGLCLLTPVSVKDVTLASMGLTSAEESVGSKIHSGFTTGAVLLERLPDGFGMDMADTALRNSYRRNIEIQAGHPYRVVVASLPNKHKAEEFIKDRGDSSLSILEADDRYRVYAATFKTASEAYMYAASEAFSTKYPDSWVYLVK